MSVRRTAFMILLAATSCKPTTPPTSGADAAPPQPIEIVIVGTSDLHGHLDALPLFAGYVGAIRHAHPNVLLLDAGDMFQGTLESNLAEGAGVVHAYDALHYDAAAIGNHEFDYGPEGPAASAEKPGDDPRGALKSRAKDAHFPFLSANVIDGATKQPIAYPNVHPTTVIERAGVKIGLIGVTSEDTPRTTLPANFAGLEVAKIGETLAARSAELRAAGATVVIALTHAGGKCTKLDQPKADDACDKSQELMAALASLAPGTLDAVVAGHTHQAMAHYVSGIPVIQSYAQGKAFGRLDLTIDPATKKVASSTIHPPQDIVAGAYEGAAIQPVKEISDVIAPDMEAARQRKERLVGAHLDTAVNRAYDVESAEGNLFADAMRASVPGADAAITNGGSLRADLPEGDLKYGSLFEAMPFDNRLATVRLTGKDLSTVIATNLAADKGILSLSGISAHATCTGNQLGVSVVRAPGDKPIRDDETLVVVTSDFLATGGDGAGLSRPDAKILPELLRDAIERQLPAPRHVKAADVFSPEHRRLVYPGKRPVKCSP